MPQDHVPDTWQSDPKLAVVTPEGNVDVRTIGAIPSDDTAPIVVADGAGERLSYSWPCWSPDGGALLVSGTGRDADGAARLEVWRVMGDGSDQPQIVFSNDSDAAGVIAPGLAHYMCWSPSGRMAAVVAQTRKGLMLHLVDARRTAPAQALLAGAPMFFAWAPDSRGLAIHAGMDLLLFDTQRAGRGTDASGSQRIAHDTPTFRTPVWNLEGTGFLYTTPSASEGVTLWRSPRDGEGREAVTTTQGMHALTRAPRSDLVALMRLSGEGLVTRGLTLVTPGGTVEDVATGPITALIWAPDAAAIYVISPLGAEADLTLLRLDLESCATQPLARFRPSVQYATFLAFFDQYAQSHSVVSADGRWFTFSGLAANNGGGGRPGMGPQNGCYVVPTDGSAPPRRVADGELAFFPPASSREGPSRESGRFREPPSP